MAPASPCCAGSPACGWGNASASLVPHQYMRLTQLHGRQEGGWGEELPDHFHVRKVVVTCRCWHYFFFLISLLKSRLETKGKRAKLNLRNFQSVSGTLAGAQL